MKNSLRLVSVRVLLLLRSTIVRMGRIVNIYYLRLGLAAASQAVCVVNVPPFSLKLPALYQRVRV